MRSNGSCSPTRGKASDLLIVYAADITTSSSVLDDSSISSEPLTSPTRTSEKLRADLEAVNAQLASMKKQWDEERRKLVGDNAALQDAAKRLNAEVRQAKNESEKTKAGMQGVSTTCYQQRVCPQTCV